jgi:hypothetical protein
VRPIALRSERNGLATISLSLWDRNHPPIEVLRIILALMGLIVSTCNRTEFYVAGEFRDTSAPAFFESFYRDFRSGDEAHLFRLWANRCVRHLLQVASGLQSMVVGETEILAKSSVLTRWRQISFLPTV